MPPGSSSAAPVISPGPRRAAKPFGRSPRVGLRSSSTSPLQLAASASSSTSTQWRTARRAALQVLDAADVGRDDGCRARARRGGRACGRAAASPARAAAPSRCRPSRSTGGLVRRDVDVEAERAQVRLDAAAQLLAVLQACTAGGTRARAASALAAACACSAGTRSGSSSDRSRVSVGDAAAPCRHRPGRARSEWPYSLTVTPQPEAFMTIASTAAARRPAATRRRCCGACASSAAVVVAAGAGGSRRSSRRRRRPASGCRRRRARARSRC